MNPGANCTATCEHPDFGPDPLQDLGTTFEAQIEHRACEARRDAEPRAGLGLERHLEAFGQIHRWVREHGDATAPSEVLW